MAEAEDAKVRNPEEENSRRRGEWVAFLHETSERQHRDRRGTKPMLLLFFFFFFFFKSQNMVPAEIGRNTRKLIILVQKLVQTDS